MAPPLLFMSLNYVPYQIPCLHTWLRDRFSLQTDEETEVPRDKGTFPKYWNQTTLHLLPGTSFHQAWIQSSVTSLSGFSITWPRALCPWLHIWIIWEVLTNSTVQGTSLVIQWLRFRTPSVGGMGSIPELRFGMLHSPCSLKKNFHCPDYTPLQLNHFFWGWQPRRGLKCVISLGITHYLRCNW